VILPDTPETRVLVESLARARRCPTLTAEGRLALRQIVEAGLAHPAGDHRTRSRERATHSVSVVADRATTAALAPLLGDAGIVNTTAPDPSAVLVVAEGEVARGALDPLVRDGVPHLVVTASSGSIAVGPFVVPGITACVRCVDAHRGEHDPRRPLVVEQVATSPPLVEVRPDAALRAMALGWAVRDLVAFLDGARPSTWSTTVTLGAAAAPLARAWLRHPHCGCSWGPGLPLAG
jgi:hypothetical protein